jgi:hypothetical protein
VWYDQGRRQINPFAKQIFSIDRARPSAINQSYFVIKGKVWLGQITQRLGQINSFAKRIFP